jgi:rsbT co-antagonist protein RsbR
MVSMNMDMSRLTRMLEQLPSMVFCSRMDLATGAFEWIYLSPKSAELYDTTEAEIQANANLPLEKALPEDRVLAKRLIQLSIETGAPFFHVGRFRRRNGEIRWIETNATIERNADGAIYWYGQAVDVTEREQLAQELDTTQLARSKSDALLRAVLDALPVAVAVMESSGNILIYNAAQERMAGPVRNDHNGDMSGMFGLFRADGVTPFPNEEIQLCRVLRGEEAPDLEYVMRNPALKEEKRLLSLARPVRDATGKIVAGVMITQDIGAYRKLEAELSARIETLAASEEAKTQLIERLRNSIDKLSNPADRPCPETR